MAGHRNFNELRAKMSPERRARIDRAANAELEQMALSELRKLVGVTQVEAAAEMGIGQSALSQLESRDDMQVSTLRRIIEALGGRLEIIATLPNGRVAIELGSSRRE
jgi:predicted transcriptional regulator